MSAILRLYPRAWRERYGDEMLAMLDARPASLSDRFDLVRGAFDARLHPQVRGAATPEKEIPVSQRLLGSMAALGGLVWILGFASLFVLPRDAYGDRDSTVAFIAVIFAGAGIGIALGELGTRGADASSRRVGHVIAAANIGAATTMLFGWPMFIIGLYAFPIIGILAAVRGVRNGVFPGWFVPAFVGLAIATMVGYMGSIHQDAAIVLMGGLGVAGLVLGARAIGGGPVAAAERSLA